MELSEMTTLRKAVAAEVGALMGRHHVNQTQLSEATGIKQSYISRRLNCRQGFDVEPLARIAQHFGMTLEELMANAEASARATLDESHHSGVVCFDHLLVGLCA